MHKTILMTERIMRPISRATVLSGSIVMILASEPASRVIPMYGLSRDASKAT